MYNAVVNVTLKKSVLDPQGQTVLHALESLGFKDAKKVRVGKYFEVAIDAKDHKSAEDRIKAMCDQLLINPVIEEYTYDLKEAR
ncbi:MAG: phosphoribosylformylglycinamidine synthase subunit PurS [Candidatus Omnitrophica bacterium]|nr:phosphoribosylformylglycinamidine synthase subunit PurS [Candidatus Omnitrophota bacterium]